MGLNTYRFGIEWARIEPEKGLFSQAMLDHYARVIDGCRARGLAPVVTFSHFTAPRWFSAQGGWANPESASLFARFADKAARHFADRIHAAITFNEPNILLLLQNANVPPQLWDIQKLTLETAAKRLGVPRFLCANVAGKDDLPDLQRGLLAAHKAGKAAIKAAAPSLPVGFSLAMMDDQAVGQGSQRDVRRQQMYGTWLEVAKATISSACRTMSARCGGRRAACRRQPDRWSTGRAAKSGRPRWRARCAMPMRPPACRSWSANMAWAPMTTASAPRSFPPHSPT
jgi:beta-glucosidase